MKHFIINENTKIPTDFNEYIQAVSYSRVTNLIKFYRYTVDFDTGKLIKNGIFELSFSDLRDLLFDLTGIYYTIILKFKNNNN